MSPFILFVILFFSERIVGGHEAGLNEWPWVAALFNNGRQFCGGILLKLNAIDSHMNIKIWYFTSLGSLIDDKHILTAAHCVAHMTSTDVARMTVHLGDHNIRTNSETQHV